MDTRTSIPLAYSTNGFTERPLIEALELIAKIGYQGVELLGDRPHWTPLSESVQSTLELKSALRDLGLQISNVNGNTAMFFWPEWMPETVFEPSLSHSDAAVRQQRVDSTIKLFDWAAEIGAPRVSVTSGRVPGLSSPDLELEYFTESLAILCEEAAQRSLQLSVEYEPGLLVERWRELAQVLAKVDHPALGANLDLGHAQCAGEDPLEAIRGLFDRIWNIHIEDILCQKHYHLIPGDGDMPLASYIQALREMNYSEMVTVELYTYAKKDLDTDIKAATKAFEALSKL